MPEKTIYPYFIDWVLTEQCNLKCRHCRGMARGGLSTERAKKLIDEMAALKPNWVIMEGGEPLLRPDLFELLELMRQKKLQVHLITNGLLLNAENLDRLKKLGVKVMISIDGARKETYEEIRHGARFETVLEKARLAAMEGLLEAINFTLLKKNYREIPDVFKMAESIGAPKITFIGLKPCHNYPQELLTPREYEESIRLTCASAQKSKVEFFFDEPFFWAAVKEWRLLAQKPAEGAGILFPEKTACIFGEYLFIEPSGEVKPCSFGQLVLGNVNEKSLVEIWRDALALPLLNKIKDAQNKKGICRDCRYLPDCMGCRSRTFVLSGDWFAVDPCCPIGARVTGRNK